MDNLLHGGLADAALFVIIAILAVAVIVAVGEWRRNHREREIYRQTHRDAANTIRLVGKIGAPPRQAEKSRNS
jgi:hypothetical protein